MKFKQIVRILYRSYEVYIDHIKFTQLTWSLYKSYEVYTDHMHFFLDHMKFI